MMRDATDGRVLPDVFVVEVLHARSRYTAHDVDVAGGMTTNSSSASALASTCVVSCAVGTSPCRHSS